MPTVRIREETREALRELAQQTHQPTTDLLARAVDQFRRSLILAETNVAYGALRADAAAWAEIGFNGPSSPRGHIRLGLGKRDPWEAEEQNECSSVDIVRRNLGKGSQESGEATH